MAFLRVETLRTCYAWALLGWSFLFWSSFKYWSFVLVSLVRDKSERIERTFKGESSSLNTNRITEWIFFLVGKSSKNNTLALIIFYPTNVANGFVIRLENLSRHLNDSLIFIIELAFSCYNTIIQTAYCAQNCTMCHLCSSNYQRGLGRCLIEIMSIQLQT